MTLRTVNNILLIILVLVNVYVIAVPFMPQLLFRIEQRQGRQEALEKVLTTPPKTADSSSTPVSEPNHLIIPAMLLNQPIVEGTNVYKALDQGVWRWPGGSTPDKGSNTVLVGHRFTYTQPKGVFYFLNKLHVNDTVGIVWHNTTYVYRVFEVKVVPPTQTDILNKTKDPTLTMYTCTPLWLPKDRLVVISRLETVL
jgi:sortase A